MVFWVDEDGATAIEYALIAALVAITIIVALTNLGAELSDHYHLVAKKFVDATSS